MKEIKPKKLSLWQSLFAPLGLAGETTIPITNGANAQYTCSLYFGSSAKEMILVPDTGSRWLIVEDSSCDSCLGNKYDSSASSTFTMVSTDIEERNYGSARTSGFQGLDRVCMEG